MSSLDSITNEKNDSENLNRPHQDIDTNSGIIAWFTRNSVAANLLMIFILVGGFFTINTINKQMFPQLKINWISYNAPYPGAAPQEVEEGITIKVEEALESVQGLKRVITYSNRNYSNGWFEVDNDYDPQLVLEEVKSTIDSISSFPDGMERIKVEREKFRQEVMYLSLYGDLTIEELKELGRKIHDEIQQLSLVNISDFYSGLDSIKEKIKQNTTTKPIDLLKAAPGSLSKTKGKNTAIVVNTPNVAGIATRLTPRMTLSVVWPCCSISSWALSPITIASSTTIPSTNIKANRLVILIVTLTNSIGITNRVPKKHTGKPIITQNANLTRKNNANMRKTNTAPLFMLSIIISRRPSR